MACAGARSRVPGAPFVPMKRLIPFALLALAACSKADNDAGPGGVSMGEARALDDAAEMVETNRVPDDALRPPLAPASAQPQQQDAAKN